MRRLAVEGGRRCCARAIVMLLGLLVWGWSGAARAEDGAILVSAWQAASFESLGPNLRQQLSARFPYPLAQTDNDLDVMRLVRANARSVGFVQRDLFVDRLRHDPLNFDGLEFYGDIPACVVAIVRKGSRIETYADLVAARRERPISLDVGPATGRVATTFALLREMDPALGNLRLAHRGGARALSRVASGETDVALLIAYAPYKNADLEALLDRGEVDLVPFTSRTIAAAAFGQNAPYLLREISLGGDGWFHRGRIYHTMCTSLGVVVNEKADIHLSEAVAHAMLRSDVGDESSSSLSGAMNVLLAAVGEAKRMVVELVDFVSARLFGPSDGTGAAPALSGGEGAHGFDAAAPADLKARPTLSPALSRERTSP